MELFLTYHLIADSKSSESQGRSALKSFPEIFDGSSGVETFVHDELKNVEGLTAQNMVL